jgi:hypothetical protein
MHVLDGFENFIRRSAFEQVTARSHLQCLENSVAVVVNRQHDDLHIRQQRPELARAFNARHFRQVDVHEHHLWAF